MTIAFVSGVSAGSTGGNTVTTGSMDTTGGNILIQGAAWYYGVTADTVVSDSDGDTWSSANKYLDGATVAAARIWYSYPALFGSGKTFTQAASASFPTATALCFSGVKASAPLDQQAGTGANNGSSLQPGSITPSEDNCLIIATLTTNGGSGVAIDSGFTLVGTAYQGGNHEAGYVAYKIQTTATAVNPTWTWTGGAENAGGIASFKAASSPPPPPAVAYFPPLLHNRSVQRASFY